MPFLPKEVLNIIPQLEKLKYDEKNLENIYKFVDIQEQNPKE